MRVPKSCGDWLCPGALAICWKYFPLVLSLILIIPFTPLEIPTIYGGDYINRISIRYRKGGVNALSFLTGLTLLPIIPSSHFPIISFPHSLIFLSSFIGTYLIEF
jgi:hypothetical protein